MVNLSFSYNTKLKYLTKFICFRKSKFSVERISVCNSENENLVEDGVYCLPCSCTNDVMDMFPF